MILPPCKACEERHDLCHSHCPKYKQYKEHNRTELATYREEKEIAGVLSALNHYAATRRKDGSKRR